MNQIDKAIALLQQHGYRVEAPRQPIQSPDGRVDGRRNVERAERIFIASQLGMPQRQIASKFGISGSAVRDTIRRITRHVQRPQQPWNTRVHPLELIPRGRYMEKERAKEKLQRLFVELEGLVR